MNSKVVTGLSILGLCFGLGSTIMKDITDDKKMDDKINKKFEEMKKIEQKEESEQQ